MVTPNSLCDDPRRILICDGVTTASALQTVLYSSPRQSNRTSRLSGCATVSAYDNCWRVLFLSRLLKDGVCAGTGFEKAQCGEAILSRTGRIPARRLNRRLRKL